MRSMLFQYFLAFVFLYKLHGVLAENAGNSAFHFPLTPHVEPSGIKVKWKLEG